MYWGLIAMMAFEVASEASMPMLGLAGIAASLQKGGGL
jgi:hypothetical protein